MENKLSNFEILNKLGSKLFTIKLLGTGAYSTVFKVQRKSDRRYYALKMVKLLEVSAREKQNALNEVRIIASIQHPNIAGFKECFIDEISKELCIVMEFADNGDLLQKIQTQIKLQQYIPEKEIWKILISVLLALNVLHQQNILHRDLKCANIFLFENGFVKLGDFNVSKLSKQGLVYTQTGTPYYASPEVWEDKPYDRKADIWSLGCVIYETCALKPSPFKGKDMDLLYKAIQKGQFSPIPGIYSNDLVQIIKSMLQVSPENRPDCGQLLQMTQIMRKMQVFDLGKKKEKVDMLKTIKWPSSKNNKHLQQNRSELIQLNLQLPESNYEELQNQLSSRVEQEDQLKEVGFKIGSPKKYYLDSIQKRKVKGICFKFCLNQIFCPIIQIKLKIIPSLIKQMNNRWKIIITTKQCRKERGIIKQLMLEKVEFQIPIIIKLKKKKLKVFYLQTKITKKEFAIKKGQQRLPSLNPTNIQRQIEDEYQLRNDEYLQINQNCPIRRSLIPDQQVQQIKERVGIRKRETSNKASLFKLQDSKQYYHNQLEYVNRERSVVSLDVDMKQPSNELLPKLQQKNGDYSNQIQRKKH